MPHILTIDTPRRDLIEITDKICDLTASSGVQDGLANLFIQHTSASLVIQENADPDVCRDLLAWFDTAAPESDRYRHIAEGPDDMPAHIKSALTATSLSIPVIDGELALGAWQGVYVFEHRRAPHRRRIIVSFVAEA